VTAADQRDDLGGRDTDLVLLPLAAGSGLVAFVDFGLLRLLSRGARRDSAMSSLARSWHRRNDDRLAGRRGHSQPAPAGREMAI
jgi:hypothetical protein